MGTQPAESNAIANTLAGVGCGGCDSKGAGEHWCIACCCPCLAYGQVRERAGLQPCIPAVLTFLLPILLVEWIWVIIIGRPIPEDCQSMWGPQDCKSPWRQKHSDDATTLMIRYPQMLYMGFLLGKNRSALQRLTGSRDGRAVNYILGAFCTCCVLSQEHRVIGDLWRANRKQPLPSRDTSPVVVLGTVAPGW